MVTIATWNVNSINARSAHLQAYLARPDAPDILCLQELKCTTDAFPYSALDGLGYNHAVHGQKTYNGVAILSKYPIDEVITTLPGEGIDHAQARYLEAVISLKGEAIRVVSVYVPNGQGIESDKFTYKKLFLDRLAAHARTLLSFKEKLVIAGDFNVAPTPLDVHDPIQMENQICFHLEERARIRTLYGMGLTDAYRALHPQTQAFSWWDYRQGCWPQNKGLRIDYLLLSPEATDCIVEAGIDTSLRGQEKPSDHTPVWCRIGGRTAP